MPTRAFRIAYDGRDYFGFQRQPDVPTVEDAVFDALRDLDVLPADADRPAGYAAAGRTDAGVSALAQTVAFEAPDWLTPRAFGASLPPDVRAWAAADAPADFHATHDATRREYAYHLYAPAGVSPPGVDAPVDDDRLDDALAALSGSHDFANFTPDDRNTERSPTLSATREGAFVVVTVSAGGFARELVRRLVSLARDVATGTAPPEKVDRALDPDPLPGHEGIEPAPPEPLVLAAVDYPGLSFSVDEAAAATAREIFERRRVDRLTAARVSAQVHDGIG